MMTNNHQLLEVLYTEADFISQLLDEANEFGGIDFNNGDAIEHIVDSFGLNVEFQVRIPQNKLDLEWAERESEKKPKKVSNLIIKERPFKTKFFSNVATDGGE